MCINDVTVQICQLHNIAVTLASCMFTRIVKYSIAKSLRLQQIWNDFVDTHSITSKVENSIRIMFMIWMRSFTLLLPWILKWYFLPLISYISLSLSLSINNSLFGCNIRRIYFSQVGQRPLVLNKHINLSVWTSVDQLGGCREWSTPSSCTLLR